MIKNIFPRSDLRRYGAAFCAAVSLVSAPLSTVRAGLFGPEEIASTWNASTDGGGKESVWYDFRRTEKQGLSVAVGNDEKNLYVYVAARDSDSAAQLSGKFKQAFTVWLDGKCGKNKVYGIKLDVKAQKENEAAKPAPPAAPAGEKETPEKKEIPYAAAIVNKKGPISSLKADGVAFRTGLTERRTPMFEFRFPLEKLTLKSAGFIEVGFETSKLDDSVFAETASPASAGIGGAAPTKGSRRKFEKASSAPGRPEPISFWLKIKLASKP